jgi:hypothetical protein
MGQYYKPVVLNESGKPAGWVYSHDIKHYFKREGETKGVYLGNGLKLMEHSWIGNKFVETIEFLLTKGNLWYMKPIVWAGDYADGEDGNEDGKGNLWDLCDDKMKTTKKVHNLRKEFKYIVNHTKKLYVDKAKVPGGEYKDWKIHPLPLLTAEGNNRGGGGDFRGDDHNNIIGSWARNIISVESVIPEGYTELVFNLTE